MSEIVPSPSIREDRSPLSFRGYTSADLHRCVEITAQAWQELETGGLDVATVEWYGKPKHDMRMPVTSWPHIGTNGLGTFIPDIDIGKKRDSTVKDIADCVKLADALDGVSNFQ